MGSDLVGPLTVTSASVSGRLGRGSGRWVWGRGSCGGGGVGSGGEVAGGCAVA